MGGDNMIFKKTKMVERLTKLGLTDKITPEIEAIMDNLDGQEAQASNWRRAVHGEPVFWVVGKNGEGDYVNEADCEYE